jgi:hypothetical protein
MYGISNGNATFTSTSGEDVIMYTLLRSWCRYETTTPVGREAAQKAAAKLQQWEHEQQAIHGPGVHAVVDSLRPEEAGLVNDTW